MVNHILSSFRLSLSRLVGQDIFPRVWVNRSALVTRGGSILIPLFSFPLCRPSGSFRQGGVFFYSVTCFSCLPVVTIRDNGSRQPVILFGRSSDFHQKGGFFVSRPDRHLNTALRRSRSFPAFQSCVSSRQYRESSRQAFLIPALLLPLSGLLYSGQCLKTLHSTGETLGYSSLFLSQCVTD